MHSLLNGSMRSRIALCITLLFGLVLCSLESAYAQKKGDKKERFDPVDRTLTTKDDVTLKATYFQSNREKEAPVVVLLHMETGNRKMWHGPDGLASQLQSQGYAVLTIDLRGAGDSKGDSGDKKGKKPPKKQLLAGMIEYDMEAVHKFLMEEHQAGHLNMNKIALVGPEMGATVATYAAVRDWRKPRYDDAPAGSGRATPRGETVRALVLISPVQNLNGFALNPELKFLANPQLGLSFMVCVSAKDGLDKGNAKRTFDQVSGVPKSEERMYFAEYPGSARGTDLLGKTSPMEKNITDFLGKHLRDIKVNWTDRRPADERK